MKLIVAIINNDDSASVLNGLTQKGYSATKLSTSGSFLRAGNTTLLIGTEDEKVQEVLDIIRKHCAQRMESVPAVASSGMIAYGYYKTEVPVGGATVFVTPIERFEKM